MKKYKILIVDDEIFNIYSLTLMLKKYFPDITIEKACNGQLAIDKMNEQL